MRRVGVSGGKRRKDSIVKGKLARLSVSLMAARCRAEAAWTRIIHWRSYRCTDLLIVCTLLLHHVSPCKRVPLKTTTAGTAPTMLYTLQRDCRASPSIPTESTIYNLTTLHLDSKQPPRSPPTRAPTPAPPTSSPRPCCQPRHRQSCGIPVCAVSAQP